jgi:pyruvate-ferredoxin/flavodoxin oxidoreductase
VLRRKLAGLDRPQAQQLEEIADYLVRKSIWIVGGDGWAYDIGFGGLDHVLALNRNVNVLVLDTEVYSNTGGQASKSTPMAATAKFAIGGKAVGKKDLGMMAMVYGHVYVAQVAFGAKDAQTVKAFLEADSYAGPSLIIAYSSCIAHGYDLAESLDHQKQATQSGLWPLYRFDPRLSAAGKNPLELDTRPMGDGFEQYAASEGRFRLLMKTNPTRARELQAKARARIKSRLDLYQQLAQLHVSSGNGNGRPSGHSLEGDTAGKENVEA